jgi:hypothetical protein
MIVPIKINTFYYKLVISLILLLIVIDFSFNCYTLTGKNYNQPTMIAQANCNNTYLLSNLTAKCQPFDQTSSKCQLFNPALGLITIICVLVEAVLILYFIVMISNLNYYNIDYDHQMDNKIQLNKQLKNILIMYIGISCLTLIISSILYLSSFQYISNKSCFNLKVDQNGCKVDLRSIREENPYPICQELINSCVEESLITKIYFGK